VVLLFMQVVPDGRKESPGGPWHFVALMPLFDPPRHDSAETIRRALNLGVSVKMITGTPPILRQSTEGGLDPFVLQR
jgi:hypothetical protein